MEPNPIDVFITYARADSSKVEPWAIAIASGGLRVRYHQDPDDDLAAISRALEQCKLLLVFLSAESMASDEALQQVDFARQLKKPVLVISLDRAELLQEWLVLLGSAPSVDLRQEGRHAVWETVRQFLREWRLRWVDPDAPRHASRLNVRRSSVRKHRLVTAAVLGAVVLLLAYFGIFRQHRPQGSPPPVAAAPLPGNAPVRPTPAVLPVPPVVAAMPVPEAAPLPTEPMKPMDARCLEALAHVKNIITSANRDHGLSEERIDQIVALFDDPAVIQDRGRQDRNGLKAYMQVRQMEWPKWLELIESMDVSQREGDKVVVVVRSSFFAENRELQTSTTGVLNTKYTLLFKPAGGPLIAQVEGETEKPKSSF